MDGGIEQNPAYGTARPFTYAVSTPCTHFLTTTLTTTDLQNGLAVRVGGTRIGSAWQTARGADLLEAGVE